MLQTGQVSLIEHLSSSFLKGFLKVHEDSGSRSSMEKKGLKILEQKGKVKRAEAWSSTAGCTKVWERIQA